MRKITVSGRNAFALVMARRIPALAAPSGSRSPARVKPEARSIGRRTRTTAARMRTRRSSFAMVSTNYWRSWSIGSMVMTGREPRRRQVDTVERGMVTRLGRHLVPDLTPGPEYGGRRRSVSVSLPWRCLSSRKHHQPGFASKRFNDIKAVEVAYTFVRNVCAHSCCSSARWDP